MLPASAAVAAPRVATVPSGLDSALDAPAGSIGDPPLGLDSDLSTSESEGLADALRFAAAAVLAPAAAPTVAGAAAAPTAPTGDAGDVGERLARWRGAGLPLATGRGALAVARRQQLCFGGEILDD